MGIFLLFWYLYIVEDTVTNTLQWCVSPALWAHLLATPGSITEGFFLWSESDIWGILQAGVLIFSLTQLFWLTSVLTVWLTGQSVSPEMTAGFFSQALIQNLLITIALKTNISIACFSQQHPKLLQAIHWLALGYFGGKLQKLANPWQG